MLRAKHTDRELIVTTLVNSFDDNKSINYIIKQGPKRGQRIRSLMEYSYDLCQLFGDIFISEDKTGCVLIMKPDMKKTTLKSVLLDVKFIFQCLGLSNVKKAMSREAKIKQVHPNGLLYYLWFIGVAPKNQSQGIGCKIRLN